LLLYKLAPGSYLPIRAFNPRDLCECQRKALRLLQRYRRRYGLASGFVFVFRADGRNLAPRFALSFAAGRLSLPFVSKIHRKDFETVGLTIVNLAICSCGTILLQTTCPSPRYIALYYGDSVGEIAGNFFSTDDSYRVFKIPEFIPIKQLYDTVNKYRTMTSITTNTSFVEICYNIMSR